APRQCAGVHAPHRDACRSADGGNPDVCRRDAGRARRRREAVPARPVPRSRDLERDRETLVSEMVQGEGSVKIHEYQGKQIFREYGMPTPRGFPAMSVDEAVEAAKKLGGKVWVVKAQIHAGGRGKGGGVKVAKSIDEVRKLSSQILGMQLKTHQTGPQGQKVRRLLIEEGADIKKELYLGMVVDRGTQRVVLMASSEGGMDIEEVAAKTPQKIRKIYID